MALPSGLSNMLSNPIGIRLVLLGLVVMQVAMLVLPFDADNHSVLLKLFCCDWYHLAISIRRIQRDCQGGVTHALKIFRLFERKCL